MPNSNDLTERLFAQAKLGVEAAFVNLIAQVGPSLRRAIDAELEAVHHDLDPTQMWNEIQDEARQRIGEFQGSTEQEFEAWMERLALRHIRHTVRPRGANIETVVKAPDREAQTIELQTSEVSDTVKADPNATITPQSHETVEFDQNATIAPGSGDTIAPDPFGTVAGDPHGTITDLQAIPIAPQTTKIFGDYEILETIAKGGMGVVYKARQRKLNRIVALKMILAGQFADQSDIDRFYAEAEAAAQLRHPNIVGIHEVGECEGQHYFSMEYIEGRSLGDLVREHPLEPRAAARFVKTISEAMHYAHEEGVLHRDLKPSNVLVDNSDVPLVTDFGLAKRTSEQSQLTVAGTVLGTPSYMPPEQASGKLDQITARSDVYSLGAILYELITGKPPFGAANPWETIKQVIADEPVSPRLLNSGVPADLETICLKCLQKDQDRRYSSAQELVDELQRFLAGEPILARPVGLVERTVRWSYRNPWPTAALAVLLLGVVGTTVGLVQARIAQRQAETSRVHLMAAINDLFTAWGDVTLLNEPGLEEVRAKLLASASNLYKQMGDQLGEDPKIQHELGVSYFRLAKMMFHLRSNEDARKSLEAGLKIQRELSAARPDDELRLHVLGESLNLLGNVLETTAARSSGDEEKAKQQFEQAETIYDEAIRKRSELANAFSNNLEYQRQLLNSRMNRGMVWQRMGDLLRYQEEYEAADVYYTEALARVTDVQLQRRELLKQLDNAPDIRRELTQDLAQGYYNTAFVTSWLGDFDATGEQVAAAVRTLDELLAKDPGQLENQYDRAQCLMLGGEAKSEQMRGLLESGENEAQQKFYDAALRSYEMAKATFDKLASKSTSVSKYRRAESQAYMRIGDLHFLAEQDQKALAAYQSAADILTPLVAEFPVYQPLLGQANSNIAEAKQFIDEAAVPEEPGRDPKD
ncbi:MAG: protein kinase [Planctomycetes bacterium]|nr:protein kinase [Planctomycetota bacterium]